MFRTELKEFAIYSLAIQKGTAYGELTVVVVKNGQLLDSGSTNTDYSMVTSSIPSVGIRVLPELRGLQEIYNPILELNLYCIPFDPS